MCEIIPSRPNKMNESEIQALVNQENTYFDDPFESEDNIDDDRCCALGSQAGGNQNSASRNNLKSCPPTRSSAGSVVARDCQARPNRRCPPCQTKRNKTGRKPQIRRSNAAGDCGLDTWDVNLSLISQLRNENDLLKRELKETKVELRTVERQCKVQSARLTKAVGKEADMPSIVERLNTEVHNLQLLLRRKSEQADAAERRYNDMEQRLLPLVDRRRAGGGRGSEPPCDARKQNQVADPLKAALEKEQQHSAELQRKLELMDRTHRSEQVASQEQIKKLRKCANELQSQLEAANRHLQEKTKLLELQNIYSQRLPKSVCALYPPTETNNSGSDTFSHSLEAIREKSRTDSKLPLAQLSARTAAEQSRSNDHLEDKVEEALNRRYKDYKPEQVDGALTKTGETSPEKRRSRHRGTTISNMVARVKGGVKEHRKSIGSGVGLSSLFSRANPHIQPIPPQANSQKSSNDGRKKSKVGFAVKNGAEEEEEVEGAKNKTGGGILGNALKRDLMLAKNTEIAASLGQPVPVPARRRPNKFPSKSPLDTSLMDDVSQLDSDARKLSDLDDSFVINDGSDSHKKGKLLRAIHETLEEIHQEDPPIGCPSVKGDNKLEDLQATLETMAEKLMENKLSSLALSETLLSPSAPLASGSALSNRPPTSAVASSRGCSKPGEPAKLDRFELCKEERLWEDLFGNRPKEFAELIASSDSMYFPTPCGSKTEDKKPTTEIKSTTPSSPLSQAAKSPHVKKTMMDILRGSGGSPDILGRKTTQQIANSMRRHAAIRNPLEDLDMEEVQL